MKKTTRKRESFEKRSKNQTQIVQEKPREAGKMIVTVSPDKASVEED